MSIEAATAAAKAGIAAEHLDTADATIQPMPPAMAWLVGAAADAITLGNRIFVEPDRYGDVANGRDPTLLAHELVHVGQWKQNGALGFLGAYVADYARNRLIGLDHSSAYRGIGAEAVAYRTAGRIAGIHHD